MIRNINNYHIIIIAAIILFAASSLHASETAGLHIDAVKLYNSGEYEKSAKLMEKIEETGIVNGRLFYNLGNAHFKAGNKGLSVLWYERAMRLIPNDPDLKYNYGYVKGFLKDKSDNKGITIYKILFFWKEIFDRKAIQIAGIVLFIAFSVMAAVQMYRGRRLFKVHTATTLLLSSVFILTSFYDFYADKYIKSAVIIPEIVHVRSGLTQDSTELFQLHTGTLVKIEEERKGYVKIRFSDSKIGWISRDRLEII